MAETGWDSRFGQNVPWAQMVTQPNASPQTHHNYLPSYRHTEEDTAFIQTFAVHSWKIHSAPAGQQRENLLTCSHGELWDFSWVILYGKGDINIKAGNDFSQVEALCLKWWGRERGWLQSIAFIAQCQGTAETWPLVAGITNRQINFWSPRESLQTARCSEISYLVTPASHKCQQSQIMGKNYLFFSFQMRYWKKKKTLKRLYLHLTPNQNAQCWGCCL